MCKRLGIDFAEAVVGFEFGHRMAVPVIQGVVVAQENYEHLIEELEKDEAERARKEDEKRRKAALSTWRNFLMGLRIADRIRQDYGHLDESDAFGHDGGAQKDTEAYTHDEDMGGGFLPEGYEEEENENGESRQTSVFFTAPQPHDEDDEGEDSFQVEYHGHTIEAESSRAQDPYPSVETSSEPELESDDITAKTSNKTAPRLKQKARRSTRRRMRRKLVEPSSEDEDESDGDFRLSDGDD